jgi:hypothetical protein
MNKTQPYKAGIFIYSTLLLSTYYVQDIREQIKTLFFFHGICSLGLTKITKLPGNCYWKTLRHKLEWPAAVSVYC